MSILGHILRQRLGRTLLGLLGFSVFAYLVHTSGVTLASLLSLDPVYALGFLLASVLVFALDTWAWAYSLDAPHIGFRSFFGLRMAGEAIANAVPGGVLLGEAYKIALLQRRYGLSLHESSVSVILLRLGFGLSHAVFILTGILLCYAPLNAHSQRLFGVPHVGSLVLGITVVMATLLCILLVTLWRGRSVSTVSRLVSLLSFRRLDPWLKRRETQIAAVDQQFTLVLGQRRRFSRVLSILFLAWLGTAFEAWLAFSAIRHPVPISTAYVIESVASLVRLVFFIVPVGIGGQDLSIFGLTRLYRLPPISGGLFIVTKRTKELTWILAGLIVMFFYRRRELTDPQPASDVPTPLGPSDSDATPGP